MAGACRYASSAASGQSNTAHSCCAVVHLACVISHTQSGMILFSEYYVFVKYFGNMQGLMRYDGVSGGIRKSRSLTADCRSLPMQLLTSQYALTGAVTSVKTPGSRCLFHLAHCAPCFVDTRSSKSFMRGECGLSVVWPAGHGVH